MLPLLLLLLPLTLAQYTGDNCRKLSECTSPRLCLSAHPHNLGENCTKSTPYCSCFPKSHLRCPCDPPEICVETFYTRFPICVSKNASELYLGFVEYTSPEPPPPPPVQSPDGALSPCSDECPEGLTCLELGFPPSFRDCQSDHCVCLPRFVPYCFDTSQCEDEELCAETPISFPWPMCIHQSQLWRTGVVELPKDTSSGYSMDPCRESEECQGERVCLPFDERVVFDVKCEGGSCVCHLPKAEKCEKSDECEDGEVCAETPMHKTEVCVSKVAVQRLASFHQVENATELLESPTATPSPIVTPSPSPSASTSATDDVENGRAICVDVQLLNGVEKVFDKDYKTWVLCDQGGNCATPGHLVLWGGRGMMMRTYCELVGCKWEIRWVNSPKGWGGRIESRTVGLQFTALAARWETRVEEGVLKMLVRLGL